MTDLFDELLTRAVSECPRIERLRRKLDAALNREGGAYSEMTVQALRDELAAEELVERTRIQAP